MVVLGNKSIDFCLAPKSLRCLGCQREYDASAKGIWPRNAMGVRTSDSHNNIPIIPGRSKHGGICRVPRHSVDATRASAARTIDSRVSSKAL